MALALLRACGTEPTPPLEGLWFGSEEGRFNHWEIRFRDEGGGVIGRAKENRSGFITYLDVPVTGRYPRVQFETGAPNGPSVPPGFEDDRAVFVGALPSECPDGDRPCIVGTVTTFDGPQLVRSETVKFFRSIAE